MPGCSYRLHRSKGLRVAADARAKATVHRSRYHRFARKTDVIPDRGDRVGSVARMRLVQACWRSDLRLMRDAEMNEDVRYTLWLEEPELDQDDRVVAEGLTVENEIRKSRRRAMGSASSMIGPSGDVVSN